MHLSNKDIERIDQASLQILDEIGIRVDDEGLRRQALAAGARPGHANDWIRLPSAMVREYVALAPRCARFADCQGRITELGPGVPPTFWTGAALNYSTDGGSRPITGSDLAEFVRIADALPSVFAVVGTSMDEVPPPARDFTGFRILAQNTRKHLRPLLFTARGVAPILEMAQVLAGSKSLCECPLVSFGYSCLSPLHWPQIATDLWRQSSGHRIPVMLNGEPVAGATSPVTLAGSLALANAEILAGVVLVQLLEPGRPVVHNLGFAHVLEMRTGVCLSGSAECALMAWAGARLADYYGLPSASWMCTDAFVEDQQATLEKVLTGMAHIFGSVNVVWGMGQLHTQKALSPLQLVIDDEIARALLRWWQGFRVNDETLALEAVREVVRSGEGFLAHPHTLAHFREELSESPLLVRMRWEIWQAQGAQTLGERARVRLEALKTADWAPLLTEEQERALLEIERRERRRLEGAT